MNWITENLSAAMADFIGGFISLFGEIVNNIFFWIVEIATETVYIINAEKFITASALALVSLCVVNMVMSGYLLETDYDAEEDPFNLIVRIAETVAFILNGNWIFNFLLGFSKKFTADLTGGVDAAGYSETTNNLLTVDAESMGISYSPYVAIIFIIAIAIIIFSVVAGLRGGELVAMMLFYPYFCLDMLTNSRERWNNFKMAYIFAAISYAFQILFFMVALKCYATAQSGGFPLYSISTIVFLVLAIKAPHFLEKYLYKSGVSNAASSGVRMLIQSAAMRGVMRA